MELRAGYKESELGVIPDDWEVIRLGDLATIHDGTHQTPKYVADGIPFYSVEHITSGDFSKTKFISAEEHHRLTSSHKIERGDILMTRIGSIGECRLVDWDVDASFYVSLALMKVHGADPTFISQYSHSGRFKAEVELHSLPSATPKKINLRPISNIRIVIPPAKEQREIAAVLRDVDALIEALSRLIAKKRDLKQAAMQQLLSGRTRLPGFACRWTEVTLGEIGDCIIGLTYTPTNVVEYGLLVLRASNIQNGRFAFEDNVYVDVAVPEHLYTQSGDMLVCVRNGSRALIGKSAVIDEATAGVTFGAFMCVYRTKHWRFVSQAFQASGIQRQIQDNIGATINQITNKDMKAFRLALPPEDEQAAIAAVLSDMDAEIAALEARLEKTRALKQGMMQELLTGRTRLV